MSSGISAKQTKALEMLLSGGNQTHAANAAGVTERTIYRWMNEDPAFAAELDRRSRKAVHDAGRRLTGALDRAVTVMMSIMLDRHLNETVRLRAANYLMAHALKLLEVTDFEERLSALEERLNDD